MCCFSSRCSCCCHCRFDMLSGLKNNISVIKNKNKIKNLPEARDMLCLEPLKLLLLLLPSPFLWLF